MVKIQLDTSYRIWAVFKALFATDALHALIRKIASFAIWLKEKMCKNCRYAT